MSVPPSGFGGYSAPVAPVGFGEAVTLAFRNYATFAGRSSRAAYWWFVLFSMLVGAATAISDVVIFGGDGLLNPLFSLVILLPSLAAGARRLHDTDRSGWWLLVWFVPILGFVLLIWWMTRPGRPHDNRFGPPVEAGR